MRLAAFLAIGLACAAASAGVVADARAQGGPLPYAPAVGPGRGAFLGPPRGPFGPRFGRPFGRFRGPFAFPMHGGPFAGPPPGVFVGPRRDAYEPPLDRAGGGTGGGRGVPASTPPVDRVCFSPVETREKIAAHGLTEPVRALRMGEAQGEALRARLCRWAPEQFVYEVAVLRDDGRIVHVYMNAQNGKAVGSADAPGGGR